MGSSGIWKFHHNRNSIFQNPIFQRALYLDPVQTAPEWGALEYTNSTTAEFYKPEAYIPEGSLLGSYTNCSRMRSSGIKQNTTMILYSKRLYSKGLPTCILRKRLWNVVFWNMEIPSPQRFYIPEAYIPDGSLLGSCTNGSRMSCSGIYKFHHSRCCMESHMARSVHVSSHVAAGALA